MDTPLVYAGYFNPKPLTDKQREELEWVVNQMDVPRDPWFVYVRYHRRNDYRVCIYFPPIEASSELRRGVALFSPGFGSFDSQKDYCERLDLDWPVTGEYFQINEKGAGWPEAPDPAALPFPVPEGLTEAELIQNIGFAREAVRNYLENKADHWRNDGPRYLVSGDIDSMPFQNIWVKDDGSISVNFGWQVSPNVGWGISVGLEREGSGDGYRVTGMGNWRS